MKNRKSKNRGFTITELTISCVISLLVLMAVGFVLADGSRGFANMLAQANSEVVVNSFVAQKAFEHEVRAGTVVKNPVTDGSYVEIYSRDPNNFTTANKYSKFYASGNNLVLENGTLSPRASVSTRTICSLVDSCSFAVSGRSAQMTLQITDGKQTRTTMVCAYMNN